MPSPFLDTAITTAILHYWRWEPVICNVKGLDSILGIEVRRWRRCIPLRTLQSIYNGCLRVGSPGMDPNSWLSRLKELTLECRVDEVRVKVAYDAETTLNPRLSEELLTRSAPLPLGFEIQVSDHEGVVDLQQPFEAYLNGIKSGYREYFLRGEKRTAYKTVVHGRDLERSDFDSFVQRVRESYLSRGYRFKWAPALIEGLYDGFRRNRALLFSTRAPGYPDVHADVMVLHDGVDAYYYCGSRRQGPGLLGGVAHYTQLFCIRELARMGMQCYSLGFVGNGPTGPVDTGVRAYKRAFATRLAPIVHVCHTTNLFKTLCQFDRGVRAVSRGFLRLSS